MENLSNGTDTSGESSFEAVIPSAEVLIGGAGALVANAAELNVETSIHKPSVVETEAVEDELDPDSLAAKDSEPAVEDSFGFDSREDQLKANQIGDNFKRAVFSDPQMKRLVANMFKNDPEFLRKFSTKGVEVTPEGLRAMQEFSNKIKSGALPKPGSPVWGETGARSQLGNVARSSAEELKAVISIAFA